MIKLSHQSINFSSLVAILVVAISFHSSTWAQTPPQEEKAAHSNLSYFLDNFKCSVGTGDSSEGDFNIKNIQAGLSFGYYFYKYTQPQRERIIEDSFEEDIHDKYTTLNNSLVSLEIGIRYPERRLLKSNSFPTIEEQLLIFPIILQLTRPDYFMGYTYQTFSLGYNIKGLLTSHQLQEDKTLIPISCKDGTSFFHSLSVGTSVLAPYGVYIGVSVDIPLNSSNGLDAYYPSFFQENSITKPSRKGVIFLLHAGLDITMLLRTFYGMSFK